jgi:hypothetical protein
MSRRFYPRNAQSRADYLARIGDANLSTGEQSGKLQYPRNDKSRQDGLAVTGETSAIETGRGP